MVKYKWNLGMGCFCGLGEKGGIFTQVYLLINNSEKIVSQRRTSRKGIGYDISNLILDKKSLSTSRIS